MFEHLVGPLFLQVQSYCVLARMSRGSLLAGILPLWHDPSMAKRPLNIHEFARLGGHARAKKLTERERKESARRAAQARWAKAKKKDQQN